MNEKVKSFFSGFFAGIIGIIFAAIGLRRILQRKRDGAELPAGNDSGTDEIAARLAAEIKELGAGCNDAIRHGEEAGRLIDEIKQRNQERKRKEGAAL